MFCSLIAVHGYPLFACLWQCSTVLCSWQQLVAHLYTVNTVFNFHGNTSGIFTSLTVACSSTIHRMHFFVSMSWWLMTHLSEFRSTLGTLTRCIYFSHILLTLVSKVFSLFCTVRSFGVMGIVLLPIAYAMGHLVRHILS